MRSVDTTPSGHPGLRPFVVAPDGLLASVLLAFLTTAGIFYVNIMPALVAGLRDALHFSARDAGIIASCNVYGAALGAFTAAFLAMRVPWRRTSCVALVVLIAIDAVSALLGSVGPLMVARFLHGVTGGLLVGIGVMVIARTRVPDRGFGMLLIVQFALGGLGIMVLPTLVSSFGTGALFAALVAMSAVTLCLLPFIPDYAARGETVAPLESSGHRMQVRVLLAAALVAMFLFQAFCMSTSAFSIGMGVAFGLTPGFTAVTLGVGTWAGLLGAGAVVVFGLKFGRFWPLLAGVLVGVGCNVVLVFYGGVPWVWAVANACGSVVWAFVLPYLYGLVSAFDPAGRTAPWAGFFSKLGLATGPALGALALAETHYVRLLWWAALVGLISALLALAPARRLDASVSRGLKQHEANAAT